MTTGPVIRIGNPGTSQFRVDWSPLAQGYAQFGAGIGRGLENLGNQRRQESADRALAAVFGLEPGAARKHIQENPAAMRSKGFGALAPHLFGKPKPPKYTNVRKGQQVKTVVEGGDEFKNLTATGWSLTGDTAAPKQTGAASPLGKLLADREAAELRYGKDAPEVRVYDARIRQLNAEDFPGAVNVLFSDGKSQAFAKDDPGLRTALRTPGARIVGYGVQGAKPGDLLSTSKKTGDTLQDSIRKGTEALGRLSEIAETFDPKLLELPNQAENMLLGFAEKLGIDIGERGRGKVEQYAEFRQKTLSNMNLYIKEITGAQMSEKEAGRLKKAMPNMQDSPTEFRTKLRSLVRSLRAVQTRARQALAEGIANPAELGPLEEFMEENAPGPNAGQAATPQPPPDPRQYMLDGYRVAPGSATGDLTLQPAAAPDPLSTRERTPDPAFASDVGAVPGETAPRAFTRGGGVGQPRPASMTVPELEIPGAPPPATRFSRLDDQALLGNVDLEEIKSDEDKQALMDELASRPHLAHVLDQVRAYFAGG